VYWCVQKIYSKFSQADTGAKAALICGVAAALAYFLVDRYMVSQGWVLGQPQINGASVMITIMLYGISAAALTGGGILGWFLHDASEKDSYNKIDLAVTGIKND
jgi:hypothetical protein